MSSEFLLLSSFKINEITPEIVEHNLIKRSKKYSFQN